MSIQFKSITELRVMLDEKVISPLELIQESHQLAKNFKELNCFVTMNEDFSKKKASSIDLDKKNDSLLLASLWLKKICFVQKV